MTPSPSAAADSVVRPVLIDRTARRFLLLPVRHGDAECWSVPVVAVRAGEPYRRAVVRYLRQQVGLPGLRIARVVGVLPAVGGRHRIEYVVLAGPATGAWPKDVPALLGESARWWSTAQLRNAGVRVEPDILPVLMDGYWEGWLCDGEVSLE